MDVTSTAEYGAYSSQALTQQKMQVAMLKQANEASKTPVELTSQAVANADRMVPTAASSGIGSIIDITV